MLSDSIVYNFSAALPAAAAGPAHSPFCMTAAVVYAVDADAPALFEAFMFKCVLIHRFHSS